MLYKSDFVVYRISECKLVEQISSNVLDAKQNAFLNHFGKIVVTFFQKKQDDAILLSLD